MAKKKKRKSSGLTKFRSFVNKKTRGVSKRVNRAEVVLRKAKRAKAAAVKKAQRAFKRRRR
jgi:hypothetical protein